MRSLRAALRPLPLTVGVDLVVVGEEDAQRLAGSRWHVVARALREGKDLDVAGKGCAAAAAAEAGPGQTSQSCAGQHIPALEQVILGSNNYG